MPKRPPEPEPDPRDTRINVRVDRTVGQPFRQAAEALGIDKTALIRMLVVSFNNGTPMPHNPLLTTPQER